MPFCETGAGRLYYRLDGTDDKPVVVLHHSLGLDHGMWDAQAADLAPHFRVLRFDARGHGASSAPTDAIATIEALAREEDAGVLTRRLWDDALACAAGLRDAFPPGN